MTHSPAFNCVTVCHRTKNTLFYKNFKQLSKKCIFFLGGANGVFTDQSNQRYYNRCPGSGLSSFNQFHCLSFCSTSDILNRLSPSGTGKVCVPYCDGKNGNNLLNALGTQCITACDPAHATDKYLSVDKTQCVSSCILFNADGNSCLSECPGIYNNP